MSWFDTSGFASLAKTALKEAQKTIDKALDIKDEPDRAKNQPVQSQPGTSNPDFFSNWGVKGDDDAKDKKKRILPNQKLPQNAGSIWGSFTGSFFEQQKDGRMIVREPMVSPDNVPDISLHSTKSESAEESVVSEDSSGRGTLEIPSDSISRIENVVQETETSNTSQSSPVSPESVEIIHESTASDSTKVNSESVEILTDSLVTTPSSVEILSEDLLSPTNERRSEIPITIPSELSTYNLNLMDKDEIKSPTGKLEECVHSLKSTAMTKKESAGSTVNLTSPESIEVIRDVDCDIDEASLAEDSYASGSESTLLTGVESESKLTEAFLRVHDQDSEAKPMSVSSSSDNTLHLSLESLKDKSNFANLHLPLEAITKQPIRKSEQLEKDNDTELFDELKSSTIEPLEISKANEILDVLLTDSSCEETVIGSSSEDNNNPMENAAKSVVVPLSTSSYVKNMLAEAMTEKQEMIASLERPREHSPISSESRSDLVKIGSDQTSSHTSGDELETTTSSDIEIISSPNGDSSSTQSRQSPAKFHSQKSCDLLTKALKTRGHSRELSEVSVGSDDANLEIERLLRRIREMTEIIEARENKLIEVSRVNVELHEQNSVLKKHLDNVEKSAERSQDIRQLTDDYTQRLSALERKFQQAIREKDNLRKTLEQTKQEASSKTSAKELTSLAEKDEIIKELREEGEKLSKQQLQHSNIIKKLRAKEKESDATIKSQKEQIEEQTSELDRLKRSLHAKEEVERSQIEAVHTLTSKAKKLEKELMGSHEKLDHVTNKMEAYKKSFDAAKSELLETKEKLRDTEEELKLAIENAGESSQLLMQVEDLKKKLRQAEENHVKKEEMLKQENSGLLKRLEAIESRNEEMSESMSQATKPLLRQIEQLQISLSHKTNFYLRQEEMMSEKIADLQTKLETISETSRALSEENVNMKSRCSVLETKLNAKEAERKKIEEAYESLREENEKMKQENESYKRQLKTVDEERAREVQELKREISSMEDKLAIEKAATEAEKRKNHSMLEQQHSFDEELRYSPTLSVERDSVCSTNSIWPPFNENVFETGSGRFPSIYSSNSTSTIENLQAQLKQRDGEVQQLQWELSRRNTERDALNTEVSSLTLKIEDLKATVGELESLKESLNDTQTKYDALLQMYGEKLEETQELRLDLADVKEMYKTQIDQLLKKRDCSNL